MLYYHCLTFPVSRLHYKNKNKIKDIFQFNIV